MINPPLHPALIQLLHYQSSARLRRTLRGFATRRRFLLSCLGLVLAAVWLGNVARAIWVREPTELNTFRGYLSLGFLAYGLWHVLKVVCHRPTQPFDLPPAEYALLCSSPFQRRDLVAYRLTAILRVALFKAFCFSLAVMVDLSLWIAGFVGSLLALSFLGLIRMALEIATCGMSNRSFQRMRAVVVLLAITVAGSALVTTTYSPSAWRETRLSGTLGFVTSMLHTAGELRQTWIGVLVESPFRVFSRLCTAEDYSLVSAGWLLLSATLVAAMVWLAIRLDAYFLRVSNDAGRNNYRPEQHTRRVAAANARIRLPSVPWCAGVGPLAWRQVIGARRHSTGLFLALTGPGLLACLPMMLRRNAVVGIVEVLGVLALYTFVLFPSAFKFDFRRDFERFAILKTLPIRPVSMAIGQIATPTVLATMFQATVLLLSVLIRPVDADLLIASFLLLLLLNVFVFASDNLIYLLYPYRFNQEGLEIFIRTTLTFTAKALLFGLAVGVTIVWAEMAPVIASYATGLSGMPLRVDVVFFSGAGLVVALCAVLAVYLLACAFRRLDPSQDAPA